MLVGFLFWRCHGYLFHKEIDCLQFISVSSSGSGSGGSSSSIVVIIYLLLFLLLLWDGV